MLGTHVSLSLSLPCHLPPSWVVFFHPWMLSPGVPALSSLPTMTTNSAYVVIRLCQGSHVLPCNLWQQLGGVEGEVPGVLESVCI